MDSQQARQVLELYRPGVDDSAPDFAEALAQAQRDPELSRWLKQQSSINAAIRERFLDVAIPVGLRTRILARAEPESPAKVWWRRPVVLAVAATVVAALVSLVVLRVSDSFAKYRAEMVRYVSSEYKIDLPLENFDEVQEGLAKNGWPSDYAVPPSLKQIKVEGACLRQWKTHKVSLVCMEAKHGDAWLFVVKRADLPDAPTTTQFFRHGKITTASWTAGGLTYILATEGDEASLRSLL